MKNLMKRVCSFTELLGSVLDEQEFTPECGVSVGASKFSTYMWEFTVYLGSLNDEDCPTFQFEMGEPLLVYLHSNPESEILTDIIARVADDCAELLEGEYLAGRNQKSFLLHELLP